jgi:hypothetical protein
MVVLLHRLDVSDSWQILETNRPNDVNDVQVHEAASSDIWNRNGREFNLYQGTIIDG